LAARKGLVLQSAASVQPIEVRVLRPDVFFRKQLRACCFIRLLNLTFHRNSGSRAGVLLPEKKICSDFVGKEMQSLP
jgi:hypothetical protein